MKDFTRLLKIVAGKKYWQVDLLPLKHYSFVARTNATNSYLPARSINARLFLIYED